MENLVVVPQFNLKKEDVHTLVIIQEVFGSSYSLVPFDARQIAEGGGMLNCASWTVKSEP